MVTKKPKFKVDWKWFRDKREAISSELSQNELARRLSLDEGTMSKIMGGHQKATITQALAFARMFDVTLPEVLEKLGYDLRGLKIGSGGFDERMG